MPRSNAAWQCDRARRRPRPTSDRAAQARRGPPPVGPPRRRSTRRTRRHGRHEPEHEETQQRPEALKPPRQPLARPAPGTAAGPRPGRGGIAGRDAFRASPASAAPRARSANAPAAEAPPRPVGESLRVAASARPSPPARSFRGRFSPPRAASAASIASQCASWWRLLDGRLIGGEPGEDFGPDRFILLLDRLALGAVLRLGSVRLEAYSASTAAFSVR